jgi:hypothetical protein
MLRSYATFGMLFFACFLLLGPSRDASAAGQSSSAGTAQNQTTAAPAPPAPPLPPESLIGMWKLNAAQSDDPEEKMKGSNQLDLSNDGSIPTPYQAAQSGSGRQRGGEQGRLAGAGPLGGPVNSAANAKDNEKTVALLHAPATLTVNMLTGEFDLTDELGHKSALFTDGRKLQKSKNEGDQEIAAAWTAGALSYDEKGPRGEKITFSYQVSRKTQQLVETIAVDNSRIFAPVMIRYVFDSASNQPADSH